MTIQFTTDLTSSIYQDAVKIRKAVFVAEQHVPESLEIDKNEAKTVHFVDYIKQQATGTARLLPQPEKDFDLIQRVAVAKDFRHQKIGSVLIQAIISYHQSHYPHRFLQLGAQIQAVPFYKQLGFIVLSDEPPYIDAGIQHREMRYTGSKE